MLKLAAGMAFLIAVPVVAGAWLIGTSNQLAGLVTLFMGVILAMFMLAVVFATPPKSGGWTQPTPD